MLSPLKQGKSNVEVSHPCREKQRRGKDGAPGISVMLKNPF